MKTYKQFLLAETEYNYHPFDQTEEDREHTRMIQNLHKKSIDVEIANAEYVAEHGKDHHRDMLLKYPKLGGIAKRIIVKHGNDLHRDQLIEDKDTFVRAAVAKYGTDLHRDILMYDESPTVRMSVAEHGNIKHKLHLAKDKDEYVRKAARK
jgi:hypothetical protein